MDPDVDRMMKSMLSCSAMLRERNPLQEVEKLKELKKDVDGTMEYREKNIKKKSQEQKAEVAQIEINQKESKKQVLNLKKQARGKLNQTQKNIQEEIRKQRLNDKESQKLKNKIDDIRERRRNILPDCHSEEKANVRELELIQTLLGVHLRQSGQKLLVIPRNEGTGMKEIDLSLSPTEIHQNAWQAIEEIDADSDLF